MKEQNEQLKPEQSLDIIQKMIQASRQQFSDNGSIMILWAIVLSVAALINYSLLFTSLDSKTLSYAIIITWIALPVIGGIASSILGRKQSCKQKVKTHLDNLLSYMWIGYGITLFFIIYFTAMHQISPIPFILLLTGFATFIYGLGLRYKPFIIGGSCFWIFAIICVLISYQNQLLIFALSVLAGYLVPGIMLYKKVKKENVQAA